MMRLLRKYFYGESFLLATLELPMRGASVNARKTLTPQFAPYFRILLQDCHCKLQILPTCR